MCVLVFLCMWVLGEGGLVELPPCDGGNDYQDYQARFPQPDNKLSVISYTEQQLLQFSTFDQLLSLFVIGTYKEPISKATYGDQTKDDYDNNVLFIVDSTFVNSWP